MKPKIVIENDVFLKVMHWINKSNDEVSGLGTIRIEPDGVIRVVSAMLLPQKNGAAHTDIEAEEVNKALYELRNESGDLRWWWHSHVNMNVFWSGTDMDTIKKIGAGGWFVASVFNKKREIRSACWVQQTMPSAMPWKTSMEPTSVFLDECDTKVVEYKHPQADAWDAEYEKNVTEMRNKFPTPPSVSQPWANRGYTIDRRGYGQTTMSGTTDIQASATDIDKIAHIAPPPHRPPGMSKRSYKQWKKAHREREALINSIARPIALGRMDQDDFDEDAWGFTQVEKVLLAQEGWTDDEIDRCLDEFSPNDILTLARAGVSCSEIDYMLAHDYSATDIMAMALDWNPSAAKTEEVTRELSE